MQNPPRPWAALQQSKLPGTSGSCDFRFLQNEKSPQACWGEIRERDSLQKATDTMSASSASWTSPASEDCLTTPAAGEASSKTVMSDAWRTSCLKYLEQDFRRKSCEVGVAPDVSAKFARAPVAVDSQCRWPG
mmetsp:Transcript_57682/g.119215  ORF Transcript_57682/g.119215 Transcript_57682/m.119215 type:complete len:133 (-) Transcript_57682:27-425(-)